MSSPERTSNVEAHSQQRPERRCVFENVLLYCPEVATGGPEAMHQLAFQIVLRGGKAHMAYYGPYSRLSITTDKISRDPTPSPMLKYFSQYQPQSLSVSPLNPETLIIYPEITTNLLFARPKVNCKRAIWWLSVDNAILKNPRLLDAPYRHSLFAKPDIIHFYQSEYAYSFLKKAGATSCYPLSDYTDPQFITRSQTSTNNPLICLRENKVCFFPTKGAAIAKNFIAGTLQNRIQLAPIHGMTKTQVQDTLFNAKLYIDFGHHPGKDRVPREAAAAGAIVLVHAVGSARFFNDYPLAPEYLFTSEDVVSGALHNRIDAILNNPQKHFDAQNNYRQLIKHEQGRFDSEVCAFFFNDK